jgi:hypothetical protein
MTALILGFSVSLSLACWGAMQSDTGLVVIGVGGSLFLGAIAVRAMKDHYIG